MRVLLSTYDSRGGVEPLVALVVRLRALGAQVRMCAPPDEDFAQRLAGVGVPLVPVGQSARAGDCGAYVCPTAMIAWIMEQANGLSASLEHAITGVRTIRTRAARLLARPTPG